LETDLRWKIEKTTIDIITSALNEESCIDEFMDRVNAVFKKKPNYKHRITVIVNGSKDKTWDVISNWARKTKRVRGIR
jgi:hypothetical protein